MVTDACVGMDASCLWGGANVMATVAWSFDKRWGRWFDGKGSLGHPHPQGHGHHVGRHLAGMARDGHANMVSEPVGRARGIGHHFWRLIGCCAFCPCRMGTSSLDGGQCRRHGRPVADRRGLEKICVSCHHVGLWTDGELCGGCAGDFVGVYCVGGGIAGVHLLGHGDVWQGFVMASQCHVAAHFVHGRLVVAKAHVVGQLVARRRLGHDHGGSPQQIPMGALVAGRLGGGLGHFCVRSFGLFGAGHTSCVPIFSSIQGPQGHDVGGGPLGRHLGIVCRRSRPWIGRDFDAPLALECGAGLSWGTHCAERTLETNPRLVMNLKAHRLEVGHGPHSLFSCPPEMEWQAGGLHVVLGGNGSGKSTLLRTLLGLHPALEGEVFLKDAQGGVLLPSDANWVRKMSYVPSKPPSQVGLKVQEVLALSGEVSRAADWHAALKPWLGQRMTELSDGQAQQVMVARAMLQTETWVMMDEPTAFLDVHAQRQLWSMLRVHLGGGGGVFLATHDLWGVERVMARLSKEELRRSSLSWIDGQELKPLDLNSSKDVLADLLSQG